MSARACMCVCERVCESCVRSCVRSTDSSEAIFIFLWLTKKAEVGSVRELRQREVRSQLPQSVAFATTQQQTKVAAQCTKHKEPSD